MRAWVALTVLLLLALTPGVAFAGGMSFHSPSGNIRCTIAVHQDLKAAACVTLSPGRAADVLDGERSHIGVVSRIRSVHPGFRLGYGQSVERFGFRCTSRFRGVTCSDLGTGQGFTICAEGASRFPGGSPTPCHATSMGGGGGSVGGSAAAVTKPPAPQPQPSCSPNYRPCIPNSPTDLNCADIASRCR